MKLIIKFFPEIMVKSRIVRKQLISQLKKNLRKVVKSISNDIDISGEWDYLEVDFNTGSVEQELQLIEQIKNTPGIDFILKVKEHSFENLEQIKQIVIKEFAHSLTGKTFCVRVKRSGKHAFKSIEAEREIGGALLQNSQSAGVKLKQPDTQVNLEVKQDYIYTIDSRIPGLGGFPMGSQESCVSLISGGFDSSVASYFMIKRGVRTHFCFFNLGGMAHEVGVKQVAHYLWKKYSSSHRVLFISIPFEAVVSEILNKVHHSQMGVVLKRMMFKVADKVATEFNAPAIVTGESIAQVSSQTMTNLAVIDQSINRLVLRPLATMNKQEIISISRETGTEAFSASMPEYCGVISDKPTTCAKLHRVEKEESNFDFDVLEQAFNDRKVENIDQIYQSMQKLESIEIVNLPKTDDVVIDIRHPDEMAIAPLVLTHNSVLSIPFFKLQSTQTLEKEEQYLLYCDNGIMSQLQAEELLQKGYKVKVYQP